MFLKLILLLLIMCPQITAQQFGAREELGLVEFAAISEASGVVASRKNTNVLWTHNDSGDQNRIFALSTRGRHLGVYHIAGVLARDWEDIAIGPGPRAGQQYLYIGDIGDNKAKYDKKFIYRIAEPTVSVHQTPVAAVVSEVETLTFQYPDGNRDAEALMLDPLTNDLYIITKREEKVGVYRAPFPQPFSLHAETVTILERVATLDLTWVTAADISPSGLEILVKTYTGMYYWNRSPNQAIWQTLATKPQIVPYIMEPQGEAVGWAADGSGYFTLSEVTQDITPMIYFYPRVRTGMSQ